MFTKIVLFIIILIGLGFGMMDYYERDGTGEEYNIVLFIKNLFKRK